MEDDARRIDLTQPSTDYLNSPFYGKKFIAHPYLTEAGSVSAKALEVCQVVDLGHAAFDQWESADFKRR